MNCKIMANKIINARARLNCLKFEQLDKTNNISQMQNAPTLTYSVVLKLPFKRLQVVVLFLVSGFTQVAGGRAGFIIMPLGHSNIIHCFSSQQ